MFLRRYQRYFTEFFLRRNFQFCTFLVIFITLIRGSQAHLSRFQRFSPIVLHWKMAVRRSGGHSRHFLFRSVCQSTGITMVPLDFFELFPDSSDSRSLLCIQIRRGKRESTTAGTHRLKIESVRRCIFRYDKRRWHAALT